MFNTIRNNFPSPYFILGTLFFWLSVHSIYNDIQFDALQGTTRQSDWLDGWILLSPWFFLWMVLTFVIYISIKIIDDMHQSAWLKFALHSLVMLLLLSSYLAASSILFLLITSEPLSTFYEYLTNQIKDSFQLDLFIYFGTWSVCKGILFYASHMSKKLEIKSLQHELVNERLKTLHSQLNPHFLFNTLNTISSLVRLKRENDAVVALSELSQMLRRILENKDNNDVKVKDEIEFIHSYLAIQKMRFSDKLVSKISVNLDCFELKIPSMLIHPLIENAVLHGSQLESNNNLVTLDIERLDNELRIRLTNKAVSDDKHEGFGIGISHTRERLAKLYDKFQFELTHKESGVFETLLTIPIGEENV